MANTVKLTKEQIDEIYMALGSAWELLHLIRETEDVYCKGMITHNLMILENAQNIAYRAQKEAKNEK